MRNRNSLLFMGLALALGLAAAFIARSRFEQASMLGVEAVPTSRVVIVKVEVPVGTALDAMHLEIVEWPTEFVPDGAFAETLALDSRVPRRALAVGEPILEASLLPAGSLAGLGSLISEKRRAVSVKVDPVIGVAGFVTPGSHVDVLATLRRVDRNKALPYSKVILENITVLAIDQKLEDVGGAEPHLVSVVTLEVDPQQAQMLIYSAHEGHLQLALRNPGDQELVKTKSIGVKDILFSASAPSKRSSRPSGSRIQIIKGTKVTHKVM